MTNHLITHESESNLGLSVQKKVSRDIREICKPIMDLFNVNFFSHTRAFHNGSFTSLMTQPELTEYWIRKKFPIRFSKGKGFVLERGMYVGSSLQDNVDTAILQLRQHFNVDHFIFIIEKQNDYDDMYAFATSPNNINFINQYINHVDKFQQFLHYYKEKSSSLIVKTALVNYCDDFFTHTISLSNNMLSDEKLEKYNNSIALKKWHINYDGNRISISKREMSCLKLIAKNYSIKETAKILMLSPRTVETYLNNLKSKLQCEKRSQLTEIFRCLFNC